MATNNPNFQEPDNRRFIAVFLPDGWVTLSPWIQTPEGAWFRVTVANWGMGSTEQEKLARHMADELNKYLV